jgi:hypothetical protein
MIQGLAHFTAQHQTAGNAHRAQGVQPVGVLDNLGFERFRPDIGRKAVGGDSVGDVGQVLGGVMNRLRAFLL